MSMLGPWAIGVNLEKDTGEIEGNGEEEKRKEEKRRENRAPQVHKEMLLLVW